MIKTEEAHNFIHLLLLSLFLLGMAGLEEAE